MNVFLNIRIRVKQARMSHREFSRRDCLDVDSGVIMCLNSSSVVTHVVKVAPISSLPILFLLVGLHFGIDCAFVSLAMPLIIVSLFSVAPCFATPSVS